MADFGAGGIILHEFLECFSPPQIGRIVQGLPQDILEQDDLDITEGTVLKFHRKVNPNVSLSFRDPWGGQSDNWITITVPVEFPGKVKLLPYDPVTDDPSEDHVYQTVKDLIQVFPVFVQANTTYGNKSSDPSSFFDSGDRLKLIRLIYRNDIKILECRTIKGSRLISLPMNCIGDFTVIVTNNEYLLADIVSMPPRKRRVKLSELQGSKQHKIPGLPAGYTGDLFVEEPSYFVEASPLNDPGLIIGLPHNLSMMIMPEEATFERGFLLNSFATNNRNIFPVVARITDWDEETTILENHFIKPGVELVMHGWTRQSKVLAKTNDEYFAIPLTYQGRFRLKPQQYKGVADLEHAHPAYKLRVVEVDMAESNIGLSVGDIIRVKRGDSIKKTKDGEIKYLKIEKYSLSGTTKLREIKLPMGANVVFEEISEDSKDQEFHIKELVSFLSDHEVSVELIKSSPDQRIVERDLPFREKLTLCEFIVEPAIYVSVEAVDAPAFHIPLRTQCYVSFVEQLEKTSSPLLTKQNPKLSTLDRCIEILPVDIFYQVMRYKQESLGTAAFPSFTGAHAFNGPSASKWNSSKGIQKAQPKIDIRRKRSFGESDRVVTQARTTTTKQSLEDRKYRSTENVFRASNRADKVDLSLPKQDGGDNISYSIAPEPRQQLLPQHQPRVQSTQSTQDGMARIYSTGAYQSFAQASQQQQQNTVIENEFSYDGVALGPNGTLRSTHSAGSSPASPLPGQELPPQEIQLPPGYVLMPTAQAQAIPAGYSLVPVYNQSVAGSVMGAGSVRGYDGSTFGDEDDDVDDLASNMSGFTFSSKAPSFKVAIPPEGNLYHFSVKKFCEMLRLLKIEEPYIRMCLKDKIDGKKFSRMTERDLENYGLMHPIVLHFRRNTNKKKAASKFLL